MTNPDSLIPEVRRLRDEHGWGNRKIGEHLGIGKDAALRILNKLKLEDAQRQAQALVVSPSGAIDFYEAACRALAEAKTVNEAKEGLDRAEAIRVYSHRAKNYQLEADAFEIRERYERKLGSLIMEAKEAGQVHRGRPVEDQEKCQPAGHFPRVKLEDAGISRNLSSSAQKKAGIGDRAFEAMVQATREQIAKGKRTPDILRANTTEEKQQRRATREKILGGILHALPDKRYGVILADPEWRFEPWSRNSGMDRAADNHYPTSCTEVIAARDVPSIAADDCVLFLWATAPMLPHALVVMAAWGFDYKSHAIWRKPHPITGYWFRSVHELLLVGTRGEVPAPAMGTQELSVIDAPRPGGHSSKPECFLEMIERHYPNLPKIELNRRGPPRPGWDAWGNEAEVPHDSETGELIETNDLPHPSNPESEAV